MSKDKLTDYDSTASNNTDVGGISIAEGMLPSAVNNAIREQMSHQKEAFGAGTPLYVDQTNNRVGVGTASPATDLEVEATTTNGLARIGQLQFKNSSGNFTASSDGVHIFPFSDGNVYHDNYDGGFAFRPSGTERARITANGITFNGDTAAANALDDYEFGTWNPSVGGNATYSATNYGRYVKVGNIVMAQFNLAINVLGTGSTASITGLPYTSENIGWVQTGSVSYFANLATATNFIGVYINSGSTQINFVGNTGSVTTVTHNGFGLIGNSTQIACGLTYRAA